MVRLVVLPLDLLRGLWLVGRRVPPCGLIVGKMAVVDVPLPPVRSRCLMGRQISRSNVVERGKSLVPPFAP